MVGIAPEFGGFVLGCSIPREYLASYHLCVAYEQTLIACVKRYRAYL